jgi:hypothetical protein
MNGYIRINGTCSTCPNGKIYNFVTSFCEWGVICGSN